MENFEHLNGLTLAYIGDAVYEVFIRDYLLTTGLTKPNHLHRAATRYVSAKAQAFLMMRMLSIEAFLTEKEIDIYKRGRNTKSHTSAKNTDIMTYRIATGFEAVMGYLHICKEEERLNTLLNWCVRTIGEEDEKATVK
ncbi:Mini-ribonuclease 3 [Granulicatella sp. zg-ZJ]|uniref:Mini-ribonuclease 3 n=1 Tax=unclassified Granulicatella TaxID=2630493 RepID=UPI0013BF5104|nr:MULTISPECIES: Mini-ribonuclease 3 [unclassified Granulicatella]MBS4750278.1 Mini-ribonuclease 3 [Carnobacteriaceae bacterium zg-ZUI78]NEW62520.1 Mini-ribonuclease 3 [Granulicatella sp. zg-ZJ]NEW66583.1 Mini-ribonuclease 3 [Granulicatella sp. zg-84]QMI85783.1 Mini-ribonuclease 3 [Carnobacteriaceae bacterium zg-84]